VKPLDFIVIGAQKSGTTALAQFLGQHQDICMARPKEAHAFDHKDYAGSWTDVLLSEYYGGFFAHAGSENCRGEATPIYLYLPDAPRQMHSYNPDLKLLVILRDPVERAISHYRMAVAQGYEHLPLWLASVPLAEHSMFRENSYRSRGLYARQLRRFRQYFAPGQLLVVRTEDLREQHAATLQAVFDFLQVAPDAAIEHQQVNSSPGQAGAGYYLSRLLLRLSYWPDLWRLSTLVPFSVRRWMFGKR
jgi:hypothetical protein